MNSTKRRGQLIVLSGPSGTGKSTVIAELLQARPDLYFSVSFTTRPPRPGETDGKEYHFHDVALRCKFCDIWVVGAHADVADGSLFF